MKKYEPVAPNHYCSPCCSDESEKKEPKLPCSYIVVPKGMAGVTLGEMVEVTVRGKVKGFSNNDWDGTDEVRLELHEADVKPVDDNKFKDLVDD